MSSPGIIYYGFYNNPFLRYNDNKYKLKNKGKKHLQFICMDKECKTKIWTNLIDENAMEFYIIRMEGTCNHTKTLDIAQWNKLWAINEICMMTETYSKHEAYDNWCLFNPQYCTVFHDFYEVKNKLYRFNKCNTHSMLTTKQELTDLLSNTEYKYNYWGFNKRKQITHKQHNVLNHKFIFQANIFSGDIASSMIDIGDKVDTCDDGDFDEVMANEVGIKDNDNNDTMCVQELIQLRLDKIHNQNEINKLKESNKKIDSKLMLKVIPSEFDMLFYQGNGGNNDFQCFFTKRIISHLIKYHESICDFTFAVTPKFGIAANKDYVKYVQLFSCHFNPPNIDIDHVNEGIPTLFILMANKSRKLYRSAFQYVAKRLKDLGCDVQYKPNGEKRISAFDYELHEREEFASAFAIDVIKGCLMHFSGNVRKNFQIKGFHTFFKSKKKKHKQFILKYLMVRCISLLPESKVGDGWNLVKSEMLKSCPKGYKIKLRDFCGYFENTYINGLFKLSDWNFYRSDDRTQNIIERTHKKWLKKAGHHPLPIPFLDTLREIDALGHIRYLQIQQHAKTRLKAPDERLKEDNLSRLWDLLDINLITIKQFLTCTSVVLRTNFRVLDALYDKYDISYYIHSGDIHQHNEI